MKYVCVAENVKLIFTGTYLKMGVLVTRLQKHLPYKNEEMHFVAQPLCSPKITKVELCGQTYFKVEICLNCSEPPKFSESFISSPASHKWRRRVREPCCSTGIQELHLSLLVLLI